MISADRARRFFGLTYDLQVDRFQGEALATVLAAGVDYYIKHGTKAALEDGSDELVDQLHVAEQVIAEIEAAFSHPQGIGTAQNLELDLRFGAKRASKN
jgi:hypothetical protein